MLNHKNLQKNLGRTGGAANSKIVGTSSWTKTDEYIANRYYVNRYYVCITSDASSVLTDRRVHS